MAIAPSKNHKQTLLRLGLFCLLLVSPPTLHAQKVLSWEVLADVHFHEQYDESLDAYWLIPTFGRKPKAHQHQTVILEGYFIPVDLQNNFFVLSRYPYESCFFCGGAGPESVVELQISKKKVKHISMDKRVRFKGTLILNKSDFDHCNYILKEARLLF